MSKDLIERGTADRSELVSALVLGGDRSRGRVRKGVSEGSRASHAEAPSRSAAVRGWVQGALHPPYEPLQMWRLLEHSNSLRQNVDAYATNIDGHGHHLEPVVNLDSDSARDEVRKAMMVEAALQSRGRKAPKEPTDEQVDARIAELRGAMLLEQFRARSFFDYCCVDESFVALRRKTRADLELTGNAYWEVIRTSDGQGLDQFVHMPSADVRLMPRKPALVDVVHRVPAGPFKFEDQKVRRRFRTFVQMGDDGSVAHFKEFGDPRVISSRTGDVFDDEEALARSDDGGAPANEVIHFRVHSSVSPYGVPRWIGNLISVLGSRQSEEVNFLYFENKSIPPLAITVSGGRMTSESVQKIQSFIDGEIKGKRNFHKILIIEAESPTAAGMMGLDNTGRCRIEIKPLTEAHLKDALFQEYDANNIDKVGMAFRLPRLLRGDIRDFNRASAEAALDFAETQVFAPERNEFDHLINRLVMPAIGISLWRFKSNGVQIRDPQSISEMIQRISTTGGITPADARALAGELVFGRDLGAIDEEWMDRPLQLTIAGVGEDPLGDGLGGQLDRAQAAVGRVDDGGGGRGSRPGESAQGRAEASKRRLLGKARGLVRLARALAAAEEAEAERSFREGRLEEERDDHDPEPGPVEVLKMSAREVSSRLGVRVAR